MESFGEFLRRERELRHIELDEIAKTTRIKKSYLQSIESDSYEDLPSIVFIKGFIRSYCNYLGIDPDDTVNKFQIFYDTGMPHTVKPETDTIHHPSKSIKNLLVLAIGMAAVVFIGVIYYNGSRSVEKVNKGEKLSKQTELIAAAITNTIAAEKAAITQSTVLPQTAAAPVTQTVIMHTLLLKATEPTWIRLVPLNDEKNAKDVILNTGDNASFKFSDTAILTIGNAEGIEIILDNKLIPHQHKHAEVIRIKIPR